MTRLVNVLAVLAMALAWKANAVDYRIHSRDVPAGFEKEAAFFELVKWPSEPNDVFDAKGAPVWNLNELGKYVPDDGIEFVDVNHSFEGRVKRPEILRSLKQRQGQPFTAFAHMSHIYSIPYKQYSELAFAREGQMSVVKMADWYLLTFKSKGKQLQLVR
jgi:hypothetical protein